MDLPVSENPLLIPDQPISIGYKCSWFAVKDMDARELATILGLRYVHDCNWKYGLAVTTTDNIFISPPIKGWRLVVGSRLPFGDSDASREQVLYLLRRISKVAGEAQFFATHRVVEFHCWMNAQAGTLVRAYAYSGERLEVIQDTGIRTAGEPADLPTAASLALLDELAEDEEIELSSPDEETVMAVAAAWSINPNVIAANDELPALGIVGTAPTFS
jgi:hypothetical protein